MWLKLRQIALVVSDLNASEGLISDIFGLKACFRDPSVGEFGLENVLFPIGNQFLELVAPTREDSPGSRFIKRRGGDSGYMVITQCDTHTPRRQRVAELGVRIAHQFDIDNFLNMQLHPGDTGGTFFEIDEQLGDNAHADDGPWAPAGPNWQSFVRRDYVESILAAEIQCDEPLSVAEQWASIAELPLISNADQLQLDFRNAHVRFVDCHDGRPEGLSALDIRCANSAEVIQRAQTLGIECNGTQLSFSGMRWNLI